MQIYELYAKPQNILFKILLKVPLKTTAILVRNKVIKFVKQELGTQLRRLVCAILPGYNVVR